MELDIPKGTYVVAVSGGVDSMALLHMLVTMANSNEHAESTKPTRRYIVAHFDHGIRTDSADDRRLVEHVARHYGLTFVYDEGKMGPGASEAAAREARYTFLRTVRSSTCLLYTSRCV